MDDLAAAEQTVPQNAIQWSAAQKWTQLAVGSLATGALWRGARFWKMPPCAGRA